MRTFIWKLTKKSSLYGNANWVALLKNNKIFSKSLFIHSSKISKPQSMSTPYYILPHSNDKHRCCSRTLWHAVSIKVLQNAAKMSEKLHLKSLAACE